MDQDFVALAKRALEFVPNPCRIGLGSGRTTSAFIHQLAEKMRQGLQVRAVPTSQATAHLARSLGIPLDTLEGGEPLDLTIDGADEIESATLNAIKGWGAALVRERIVAAASRQQILIVTEEKLVQHLGERGRLPIEVIPFAVPFCRQRIEALPQFGGQKTMVRGGEQPVVTDNGNRILDCPLSRPPADPHALHQALRAIPGVLDTGFFLGTASLALVARQGRVDELRPK